MEAGLFSKTVCQKGQSFIKTFSDTIASLAALPSSSTTRGSTNNVSNSLCWLTVKQTQLRQPGSIKNPTMGNRPIIIKLLRSSGATCDHILRGKLMFLFGWSAQELTPFSFRRFFIGLTTTHLRTIDRTFWQSRSKQNNRRHRNSANILF